MSGNGATNIDNTDKEAIAALATLPPLEYERQRELQAMKLGRRVPMLDRLVEAERGKANGTLQGSIVTLPDVEVWPERVNGAEVLRNLTESFTRYLALPDGGADSLALWCAHTHLFDAFICSPRLNITSPERGCGKSTLRDVVSLFVPRPVLTENLTVAVLFRLVHAHAPVILADEYDAWLKDNEELRGLLNAGHRRGAAVYRCEGDSREVREFRAYTPAVLCGIGALPGTLHDRSIALRLDRAKPGELSVRFAPRRTESEKELCRQLARWCADNRGRIQEIDPALPNGVFNRLADNWRPLFAIAEVAGEDWPNRCAEAFVKLSSQNDTDS
jgi:putative DNA primase/helicase